MKLSVSEILSNASKLDSDEQRIAYLKQNYSVALESILRGAFDPSIKWLLPEGRPDYKKNDLVDLEHIFYTECRRLYLFIEGGNPNLKQLKREQLFIEMLENIDVNDAELLLYVKDKTMPYEGITEDLIRKGFPGILGEVSQN
jgi:hypothetical protein